MNRNRLQCWFQSVPQRAKTYQSLLRPSSSVITISSLVKNKRSGDEDNRASRSPSSIWRSVIAARCQQQINKETIEPIRRNLTEKKIRLEAKRAEQEHKYTKTMMSIRNKSAVSPLVKKQHFKQAQNLIDGWLVQKKMENNRYFSRLFKLKPKC